MTAILDSGQVVQLIQDVATIKGTVESLHHSIEGNHQPGVRQRVEELGRILDRVVMVSEDHSKQIAGMLESSKLCKDDCSSRIVMVREVALNPPAMKALRERMDAVDEFVAEHRTRSVVATELDTKDMTWWDRQQKWIAIAISALSMMAAIAALLLVRHNKP